MNLNQSSKELNVNIVYAGPELSGQKTSFQYLRDKIPFTGRYAFLTPWGLGKVDFFSFVPESVGTINGFRCRIYLSVLVHHDISENTRRIMLHGADGVIFVADSQKQRAEANLSSLEELEGNLAAAVRDPSRVARVYSYNKRDLPDALPVAELEERLNPQRRYPSFETTASEGIGVFNPFKEVVRDVLRMVKGGSPR